MVTPPNNLELLMKEIMILMTKMEDYITHLAQVNEIWTFDTPSLTEMLSTLSGVGTITTKNVLTRCKTFTMEL